MIKKDMKGIIYKIIIDDKVYVGSTKSILSKRQGQHNYDLKNGNTQEKYRYAREKGVEKIVCIGIETFEYNELWELRKREEEHRLREQNCLNEKRCYLSEEETKILRKKTAKKWNEENKEKVLENAKEYYEENKEEILEKHKKYYEENKEKVIDRTKKYYEENKEEISERTKEYYEENKEKLLDYAKDYGKTYYEQNKEIILAKQREKITCECGCIVSNITRHKKSPKHIKLLNY